MNVDNIKDKHLEFMTILDTVVKKIGPPLKMNETWSSSNFFIYVKYPIYKSCPLSMSQKKINVESLV